MKVLMIEFFYPENTYTLELGEALNRITDVTIACKKNVPLPQDGVAWKGLLYEGNHSKLAAPLLYGKSLAEIAHEIRRGKYDVVNIQYMRKPEVEIPFFQWMKKHCGILADTIHTVVPHEAKPSDIALHQRLYDLCDLLIVHNQPVKRQLMTDYHVPEEKICVIPHGIYRQEALPADWKTPAGKKKMEFLMFGQMRKYKGIDVLLQAAALLPPQTRSSLHITVAGPQYPKLDATDYEQMVQDLGIGDCVSIIKRHIPVEEHAALFAQTDVCLFPYKELYGSGALLMAYSYDKPVIVSEDPIFREETDDGKTGLLFAKNDPKALADAMMEALNWSKGDYEGYQAEVRRMKTQKYSWDRAAQILKEAYERALQA